MAYQIDKSICVGCGACEGVCPVSAISKVEDKYEINPDICIDCGTCEATCPVSAISQK